MYYSKKISSWKRRARRMFRRNASVATRYFKKSSVLGKLVNSWLVLQHKIKESKIFNMSHMFKYGISIVTMIVFSYVMIYADNFGGYQNITSPNNWLAKIEIKTSNESVTLENIIIDQQQDDWWYLKIKYKVNPWETIWDIAKKFGVTSKNIRSVNKLNSDILEAWQEIVITPVEGFVVENNLWDVDIVKYAKHYGLDAKDLKELNDIVSDNEVIKKGYELFIPLTLDEGLKVWLIDKATVDSIRAEPKPIIPATTVNATTNRNTNTARANTTTNSTSTNTNTTTSSTVKAKSSSSSYYSSMKWVETYWFYKWQCTAYVAMVRPDIAKAIRSVGGGNARHRYSRAQSAWLDTSKTPSIWSVWVLWTAYGSAWHVWVVISFDDKEVCLKNMNVRGRYIVSEDCFPKSSFIWFIK